MSAPSHSRPPAPEEASYRSFLTRALTVALIAALLFLAWTARSALLLTVAAIAVAVLLDAATRPLAERTRLSRPWALAITGASLALVLTGLAWLVGSQVQSQVSALVSAVTSAAQSLEERIGVPLIGGDVTLKDWAAGAVSSWTDIVRQAAGWGFSIVGVLTTVVLVVAGGFFLAADPGLYRRGVVKLFPKDRRPEADLALGKTGHRLRQWLVAQLIAMAIVGALVSLGTWALGLGAPLALGIFAALVEFVPIVGPFIGAAPALLLAAAQSWTMLLWAALLFIAIQQVESNVIAPIIMRREVEMPPALLLISVFVFGLLFGAIGVIVAAPLTVILYVLVRELYVRRTLGQRPGE